MEPSDPEFEIHAAAREGRGLAAPSKLDLSCSPKLLLIIVSLFSGCGGLSTQCTAIPYVPMCIARSPHDHDQANPKLSSRKDADDRLPLHWAIANNHLAIVTRLINTRNFDPDIPDGSGWTPIMIASSLKSNEGEATVDLLLQKDADVNMQSFNGQTVLHFASSKDNLDIVRKLIAHKASARVKDKRGQLPLHRAAAVGSVPIVKLLLENKSPVDASDIDGMTALHHAISEGHGDTAMTLLKAGADSSKRDSDERLAIDTAPDTKVGFEMTWLREIVESCSLELTPRSRFESTSCKVLRERVLMWQ